MFPVRSTPAAVLLSLLSAASCECGEHEAHRVSPPDVGAAFVSAGSEHATTATLMTLNPEGSARFLIDAPLERIQGEATVFRGILNGNPRNLAATTGQLDIDLKSLTLSTFEDPSKNATQTKHAHNWLELGSDVPEKRRLENQWVRFSLKSLAVGSKNLLDVPETNGRRVVEGSAQGELWLHGVSVPKQVKVALTFAGPADAPQLVNITTVEPLTLSLREHDVKPRDITGKFLQGALEKVGDKIVDVVQLHVSATASRK